MTRRYSLLSLVALCALPVAAFAADGSIKVNFKLEGTAPTPAKLAVDKDAAFCGPKGLVDETIKVGPKNGIQNIVMYMFTTTTKKAPESKAALEALAKEVKVDNMGCRYEPRVTAMHTSQSLVIGNPDPIGHNSKGELFKNQSFNDLIPAGGSVKKTFKEKEPRPMPLSCNIHPWMGGYLLIADHPYFGVSDANGDITIKNVPEGTHTFVIWHETGFVTKGNQKGKASEWKLGKIEVKVAGATDLGEFTIPQDVIKKK